MRVFYSLWRREMKAYFYSPLAYVILIAFLLLMGLSFWMLLNILAQGPTHAGVFRLLLGESLFFWLALLILVPVITMRLFAEERRSGTLEALLTAPLSDTMVVMAKYTAALVLFMLAWAPTGAYAYVLAVFSNQTVPVDTGSLLATYLGIGLIGMLFLSVGLFFSSLTHSQSIAGMCTLVTLIALFFTGFLPYFARAPFLQEMGRHTSAVIHMMDFSRGVVDTRACVFYLSCTAVWLFATVKVIEVRKWKS